MAFCGCKLKFSSHHKIHNDTYELTQDDVLLKQFVPWYKHQRLPKDAYFRDIFGVDAHCVLCVGDYDKG